MSALEFVSGFVPLIVVGVLGYALLRIVRGARSVDETEPADLARQIVLYGLLYITMVLTASGATWVYGELGESSGRADNTSLAQALAFVALGLPAFTGLLYIADRRLRTDRVERRSVVWSGYLNVTLVTSLIVTMVGAYRVIRDALAADVGIDSSDIVMTLIWGALWTLHWVVLRRRHGIRGDFHKAVASIIGIVTLGIGNIGLLYVLGDRLYTEITGDVLLERAGPSNDEWAAVFAVGIATWIGFWLADYEPDPRTEAWYVTVVPVGALVGFVEMIAGSARVFYLVGVWVLGDRDGQTAVRHFDELPFLFAVAITGICSLVYHRQLLGSEVTRNEPIRSYDYLLMAAALVASIIGIVLLVSGVISERAFDENQTIAGCTFLLLGAPAWLAFSNSTHDQCEQDFHELRSQVRRSYMYLVLGVGALTALIAGIVVLQGVLEEALDGELGLSTFREHSEGLATTIAVSVAVWYHTRVLSRDRLAVARHFGTVDDDGQMLIPWDS